MTTVGDITHNADTFRAAYPHWPNPEPRTQGGVSPMTGPFESFKDATDAVRQLAGDSLREGVTVASIGSEGNRVILGQALEAAGVQMASYDDRVAQWLADWEPQIVAVVAGWVTRAHEAGKRGGDG